MPGHAEALDPPAAVRNTLGLTGVTAGAAALVRARLSRLPPAFFVGTVYLAAPSRPEGAARWWARVMQPGPQIGAWTVALGALAAGTGLYVWRGARRTTAES
ncbi:hypothetical protein [Streptomyces zaomyceticus]|uniref:hypothetical protein n=1 Tax=Streptomyces zaomyceticus TaxID=68286 RepID=UPI003448326B